jgi:hypothetical protein
LPGYIQPVAHQSSPGLTIPMQIGTEKINYLEKDGWELSSDGTRFIKTLPGGSQMRVAYEDARDWAFLPANCDG